MPEAELMAARARRGSSCTAALPPDRIRPVPRMLATNGSTVIVMPYLACRLQCRRGGAQLGVRLLLPDRQ